MESLLAGEYRIGLFSLSWILQSSQEKSKTMVMPNFGGVNKVLEMVNILGDDLQSREERGRKPALRTKNCCFFAHHAWLLGEKDDRSRFFFFAKDNEFIVKIYEKIPQSNCCLVNIGKAFFWH